MDGQLLEKRLGELLESVSSLKPVPGGGSVAAIAGAFGAALVLKVGRLSLGRDEFRPVQSELQVAVASAQSLAEQLARLASEDAAAYEAVAIGMALPRANERERNLRDGVVQKTLCSATEVLLKTARACAEVLILADQVALQGSRQATANAKVAALVASAALRAVAVDTRENLGRIKNEKFRAASENEIRQIEERVRKIILKQWQERAQ
ncbi:MAG: cyclodeaminase/cyclohydrolase family protein [Firmicutes bacterium]|nr:cyclodeaminase/cyclohydrolase family protein [Bacillota bacterium]